MARAAQSAGAAESGFLPGTSIKSLLHDGGEVVGIETDATPGKVLANLVVDCTGRGSATPRWLPELGFDAPPESKIEVNVGYSSRYYKRADGAQTPITIVYPKPPAERRAATLFAIEGGRWICTLAGWLGDHPPTDSQGFLDFARSLPAADVYRVISQAEPLSEAVPHRFPANLRRHYEKLARFPQRYLVMGDAVCSFNPVYGQGMTSAALQSEVLAKTVAQGLDVRLAQRYFREVAGIIDAPWSLAAGEDFRYPEVHGPKPFGTDFVNGYGALLHRAATRDARVYHSFLNVSNFAGFARHVVQSAECGESDAGEFRSFAERVRLSSVRPLPS